MTHPTPFLADFIRGISATAPQAQDEERIEWHSALQRGPVPPSQHLFFRRRLDLNPFADTEAECSPQAA